MFESNIRIPKKVKLIVNKAHDLQLYHPKKAIKNQPRKWRVLFQNVVEKMATAKVESDTGDPEWLCEITVTTKNVHDPIVLLVTDSKGRHIGQVNVQLSQIPPPPADVTPGNRPPLVFANIFKSELESTKKNPYPKGCLYYWMWTDEYWNADDIVKIKSKKNLSQSMHDLSHSTLNLFRRKKSNASFQDFEVYPNNVLVRNSTDVNLRGSPHKINNMKKKLKPGSDSSSSVISQPGLISHTPVINGFHSKNPFDAMTTTDISIENNIKQEEPYVHETINNKQPLSSLSHQASIGSKESPTTNKKRHGLFSKFRYKQSQSSTDLTNVAKEAEKQSAELYTASNSLGKQQGQRLFVKNDDFSKSSTDVASWFVGEAAITTNHISPVNNGSRRLSRPQSCLIRTDHNSNLAYKPDINKYPEMNVTNNHQAYASNTRNGYTKDSTMHNNTAELQQITKKNREDMTKRELIDLATLLEGQLRTISERCVTAEIQYGKLATEKKELFDDLCTVRDELCRLKLRLLESGDHKYLEKAEQKTRADVLSNLALWRKNSKI